MNPLARESVALLDAARHGDEPQPADRARIRRRLVQAGVGAAVFAGVTSGTAAAGKAAAAGGTAVAGAAAPTGGVAAALGLSSMGAFAAKVVATIAIAGSIGAAGAKGVSLYEARSGTHRAARHAVLSPGQAVVAVESPTVSSSAPVTATTAGVSTAPAQGVDVPATAATAVSAPSPRTSQVSPPASTLEAETRLLREADVALRSGDALRALALLDEHAARFPRGVLEEERAAEHILALCGVGRTREARAEVERFLRERPRSPLADRVRSSCSDR